MDFFLLDCVTSRNCIFMAAWSTQTPHNEVRGSNSSAEWTCLWGTAQWWNLACKNRIWHLSAPGDIMEWKQWLFGSVSPDLELELQPVQCHWTLNLLFSRILSPLARIFPGFLLPLRSRRSHWECPLSITQSGTILPLSLIMQERHDRYFLLAECLWGSAFLMSCTGFLNLEDEVLLIF